VCVPFLSAYAGTRSTLNHEGLLTMLVGRKPDLPVELGRDHPWDFAEKNPEWKYYDFKSHPELIPEVLEDFKSLSSEPAIQRFYRFLEWLNGPDSCLESDDCALRPLEDNPDKQFPKRRRIMGRLMVLFRREDINSYDQNSKLLLECFGFHIDRTRPELSFAAVELARFPTRFTRCNDAIGYILQLLSYSYGATDDEVMGNLDQLIAGIQTAASEVNRQIREWNLCPK
jgi:hypothetical protein